MVYEEPEEAGPVASLIASTLFVAMAIVWAGILS